MKFIFQRTHLEKHLVWLRLRERESRASQGYKAVSTDKSLVVNPHFKEMVCDLWQMREFLCSVVKQPEN